MPQAALRGAGRTQFPDTAEISPDEFHELGRLFVAVYGDNYQNALAHPLDWVLAQPSVRALAVRSQGRLAGAVLLHRHARSAFLNALAVLPTARRRGIASALVRDAIVMAVGNGAQRLVTAVDPADDGVLRLYEGLGFGPAIDGLHHGHRLLFRDA